MIEIFYRIPFSIFLDRSNNATDKLNTQLNKKIMSKTSNPQIHVNTGIKKVFGLILAMCMTLSGCGEKYTAQGHALVDAMTNDLVEKGICKEFSSCYASMEFTASHSAQVSFYIYSPKNKVVLASMFEFVTAHGIDVTGGTPISIVVYRERLGDTHFWTEPAIELKVQK